MRWQMSGDRVGSTENKKQHFHEQVIYQSPVFVFIQYFSSWAALIILSNAVLRVRKYCIFAQKKSAENLLDLC